jgi:hypothetical protein
VQPAITIPADATDVSISKSGQVQVKQAGQTEPATVGQLELATFLNERGLEAIGDNLFMETAASGAATVGTPYTSSKIAFLISAGGVAFVAGDVFKLTTSPKWTRERAEGCPDELRLTTTMTSIYNAFDSGTSTSATKSPLSGSATIDFDMHVDTQIREFLLTANTAANGPRDFRLQWKNLVGDAWTTAQSWASITWVSQVAQTFTLSTAPGAHRFWRPEVTAVSATNLDIAALVLKTVPGNFYGVQENFNCVWKAPGLDGTKTIYIGCQTYGRSGTDTWNLGFTGFRSFDAASSVLQQSNQSTQKWLSLINSAITYWFVVNGQRVIIVAKLAGTYQIAYLGFGLPYEPPSVHDFPMLVGASGSIQTVRYDSQSNEYRYPLDPGRYGLTGFYPDAQWREHANRQTGSTDGQSDTTTSGKVWPNTFYPPSDSIPSFVRENIDGSRPIVPSVIFGYLAPQHVWGEFDGLSWTSGFGTVSESVIREDRFDHLVVNNIFRTTTQSYAAVRLD